MNGFSFTPWRSNDCKLTKSLRMPSNHELRSMTHMGYRYNMIQIWRQGNLKSRLQIQARQFLKNTLKFEESWYTSSWMVMNQFSNYETSTNYQLVYEIQTWIHASEHGPSKCMMYPCWTIGTEIRSIWIWYPCTFSVGQ